MFISLRRFAVVAASLVLVLSPAWCQVLGQSVDVDQRTGQATCCHLGKAELPPSPADSPPPASVCCCCDAVAVMPERTAADTLGVDVEGGSPAPLERAVSPATSERISPILSIHPEAVSLHILQCVWQC